MNTVAKATLAGACGILLAAPVVSGVSVSGSDDREAQKKTVGALLEVGAAMHAWIEDNGGLSLSESPCTDKVPRHDEPAATFEEQLKRDEEERLAISGLAIFGSDCPLATRAQVVAALVPKYIAEVPEKDGWGSPYQFVFNRELSAIGVRSPGRDGKYEADTYKKPSKVPPDDFDRDLVSWRGFIMRWPSR